jgi:hypothetical protein
MYEVVIRVYVDTSTGIPDVGSGVSGLENVNEVENRR